MLLMGARIAVNAQGSAVSDIEYNEGYKQGNYSPFAEEGKVWNMQYYDISGSSPDYKFNYFIKGDTLIAGQDCKKLYSFNEDNDNKVKYQMALRESEGKVYFILNGSTESYLLYDFLIPVGTSVVIADNIHPDWKKEMKNKEDRLIDINGVSRHCLFVNEVNAHGEDYPSGWWIEGIGSELGPLNTWCFEGAGYTQFFLSCEVNGRVIFNRYNFKLKLMESDEEIIPKYFPEGTKWTEIRLDTLKYDSWYSKVGDEWVPNYETIEYFIHGEYTDGDDVYRKVYTKGPEWTDSLSLLIREVGSDNTVEVSIPDIYNQGYVMWPAEAYQFEWNVGKGLYYRDIIESNSTGMYPIKFFYGIIDEIKEGTFGGVRPLKYVDLDGKAPERDWIFGYTDTNGGRVIQGIGITEWNDGECLFGPSNPNLAKTGAYGERHYRSMLVHFERDGEVLYDVWPQKGSTTTATIDGVNYFLYLNNHEAVLTDGRNCSGEVDIPSEVTYQGETFVVKSMTWSAFHNNPELTKVKIPKTIESIRHSYPADPDEDVETTLINPIYMNPFRGCTALESIEVDEENPSLKSVDGVLFSQDGVGQYYYRTGNYSGTGLYCYPEGARQKSYTIPENVEWIAGAACANNQYLTVLTIPNSTKHICYNTFSGCSNLTDVYCKAENVPVAWDGAFRDVPIASATLHVPAGSLDKYKTTSPWSEFGNIVGMATSKGIMPFVQDGKVWTYEASNFIYDWEETFSLEGDTLINSRKCLKLYYTCQLYQQEHLYKGAMFEEGGKVYFFASDSTTPVLLYDFSYEPGTIIKVGEFELRINETRLVKYHGEYLKVIDYCILGDEEYPFEGIEGLGFLGGGLTCLIDGYTPVNTGGERSLKTCAVNGEVVFDLQDFYTSAQIVTNDEVSFTQDQMATIILPTAPDASKGKYYRLDRVEDNQIVFEQELQPKARVPYIIVPSEDFSINLNDLDLEGLTKDSVSIEGISFIGSYTSKELPALTGGDGGGSLYYDIIDKTPDCSLSPFGETGKGAIIGALRAYLLVRWDDPIVHGETRSPKDRMNVVLIDEGSRIDGIENEELKIENEVYDLSGRKIINGKLSQGIYIVNGRKLVIPLK